MVLGPKIKLDRELYQRLARCAEAAGYSSTDEFIRHTLEKAAAALEEAGDEEEIRKRLQGLGYLD
jgi:metal-responsive CopG/Arc/MetJ family transcriptional regulator